MITGYAELGNDATLELQKAILLYARKNSYGDDAHAFATLHDIQEGAGEQPELAPGKLLTREDLESLYKALRGTQSLAFLPPHLLAASPDGVAWHEPAQERTLFFQTRDESLNNISGTYPQPALLWIYDGPTLSVFALPSDERPTPNTELLSVPFYNTYESGNICLGSTPLPKHHDPNRTSEISSAFFQSAFTHASGRQRHYRNFGGSHSELWQQIRELGHFPTSYLMPAGKTLAEALTPGRRAY